jgi:hypothetical protein
LWCADILPARPALHSGRNKIMVYAITVVLIYPKAYAKTSG